MSDSTDATTWTAPSRSGSRTEFTRSLHRSSGSFELVFAPVLMALMGLWMDRSLGTLPVFTVGLAVFGAIGAAVAQYYTYRYRIGRLAESGELPVDRPEGQFHARNRSDGDLGATRSVVAEVVVAEAPAVAGSDS